MRLTVARALNRMVESLDAVFHALSSEPRREMLGALADGERTVGDLAAPFDISAGRDLQAPEGARGRRARGAARRGPDDDLPPARRAAGRRARSGWTSTSASGTRGWTASSACSRTPGSEPRRQARALHAATRSHRHFLEPVALAMLCAEDSRSAIARVLRHRRFMRTAASTCSTGIAARAAEAFVQTLSALGS